MTKRSNALWACLLCVSTSFAQSTHTIKEGDQIGKLAEKYRVSSKSIIQANPGLNAVHLKLGAKIRIPKRTAANDLDVIAKNLGLVKPSGKTIQVRSGDFDTKIANRAGTSRQLLRAANPGVNWDKLKIGQYLRVPSGSTVASNVPTQAKVTAVKHTPTKAIAKTLKALEGDNDWVIARKVGTKPSVIRQLNPNVNWENLKIGTVIRVPGSVQSGSAVYANIIRTRRAAVIKDDATIRRGGKTSSEAIATVDRGTMVTVLDRQDNWYKLRFPKGTVGWMRGDLLKPVSATQVASTRTKRSSSVRVASYKAPSKSSRRSRTSSSGGREITSTSGYALLDQAKSYLGTRYRYGGTSRGGIDCSGFTSTVYRSQGIKIPRTAMQQSKVGKSVSKSDLKKGDLIFFKTNRGTRVNHVGMYIGNGQFIHASSGGGRVKTDSLTGGYYERRYAGAKRITSNLKKTSGGSRDDNPPARSSKVASTSKSTSSKADAPQSRRRVSLGTDEVGR